MAVGAWDQRCALARTATRAHIIVYTLEGESGGGHQYSWGGVCVCVCVVSAWDEEVTCDAP